MVAVRVTHKNTIQIFDVPAHEACSPLENNIGLQHSTHLCLAFLNTFGNLFVCKAPHKHANLCTAKYEHTIILRTPLRLSNTARDICG